MCSVLAHFDHFSLRETLPNYHRLPAVPREGETLTVHGRPFVVHQVHWWIGAEGDAEDPREAPDVRLVLRTPEEYRRLQRYNTPG